MKWEPTDAKDNSQDGYTGNVFIDAYKLNGTRLWRIDLGRNIRAGAHYTQFSVYDLDGDGNQDSGEPGLSNVTVTAIRDDGDNIFGNGADDIFVRTTGNFGRYLFVGIPDGNYQVTVTNLPPGLINTSDPDGPGIGDSRTVFALASNDRFLNKDWGYVGTGSISGFVYRATGIRTA